MKPSDIETALREALTGPRARLAFRVDGSELMTKKRLIIRCEIDGKPVTKDEAIAHLVSRMPSVYDPSPPPAEMPRPNGVPCPFPRCTEVLEDWGAIGTCKFCGGEVHERGAHVSHEVDVPDGGDYVIWCVACGRSEAVGDMYDPVEVEWLTPLPQGVGR